MRSAVPGEVSRAIETEATAHGRNSLRIRTPLNQKAKNQVGKANTQSRLCLHQTCVHPTDRQSSGGSEKSQIVFSILQDDELSAMARQLGFLPVASGPFIRSYHARERASPALRLGAVARESPWASGGREMGTQLFFAAPTSRQRCDHKAHRLVFSAAVASSAPRLNSGSASLHSLFLHRATLPADRARGRNFYIPQPTGNRFPR